MKTAIVFSSKTGNTALLAETLRQCVPASECLYFGKPCEEALQAERLLIGFWTDKGQCDEKIENFLKKLQNKEIFLFGTAGFGQAPAYFESILKRVQQWISDDNRIMGSFMCQGKMPLSVRQRYVQMLESPNTAMNAKKMIENFDQALSHPDDADLKRLVQTFQNSAV